MSNHTHTGPRGQDTPGLGPWRSATPPDGFAPFPDEVLTGSVAVRLAEMFARFPDRPALRGRSREYSYGELGRLVADQAGAIQAAVGRDEPTPVALMMSHDAPLVATILSVIAAGHVVVVLDPVAPRAQHDHLLSECAAPLLLHDAAHADAAASVAHGTGGTTRAAPIGSLEPFELKPTRRTPDDPMMLAFTSGTSGAPKGGTITHAVVLNLVRGATNALGIGPDDRMPMLFPTSLAVAAYPMFLPLLNGGTLATFDLRSEGLNPLADFLIDEQITLAYMAPTVVRFLVDVFEGREFPDLRLIALGGEVVDTEAVQLGANLMHPRWMANGFGTTETGVITLYVFDPDEPFDGEVPAGYAVPEAEVHILDGTGRDVAPGASGEVAVVSPHLFAGYWGHPELTAQVLGPDPAGRPGWQLYRTGDLGRLDTGGALTVLGRLDTKVKVRGRFVVLGDVEAMLHGVDEIADAAVVANVAAGITELTAIVVLSGDDRPTGPELRSRLLERHEPYEVPTHWRIVSELPHLPNGKVDRRALQDLEQERDVPARSRQNDRHGTDLDMKMVREVRNIWEELLPAGPIGPDDDFTDLGGDSLLAARMLIKLEERTGVTVPMGELVGGCTVRSLTETTSRLAQQPAGRPTTAACVQEGDPSRPRLWFVHDLQGSAYRVRHLAEYLGADQPVWSFESPLLGGEPNDFDDLTSFAARYVDDLRRSQPEGPYWLAGYSFGGICAYEMARQLARAGDDVAFCGIVDVGPGYRGPGWGDRHSPVRPWFGVAKPPPSDASGADKASHYYAMAQASPKGALRHLMIRSGLARLVDPVRFRVDLRTRGRVRPEWRLWYAWEEHWKLASQRWDRTNRYDSTIDLFWADATASDDATMGWGPLVRDIRIHRFAGHHEGILEPSGASALAACLRITIDRLLD